MKEQESKYNFAWPLIRDAFAGRSVVDTRYMTIRSPQEAQETIQYYGYDWGSQSDRNLLMATYQKAIIFINKQFVDPFDDPLQIPDDLRRIQDLRQVLMLTNPRSKHRTHQLWACAILKVMHTILHLENDSLVDYFPEARRQIFERFNGHLYIDDANRIYLGQSGRELIPLFYFEVKREKDWTSKVLKLLHKPENTAARIFDHIGVRIVPENLVDLLFVFNYLIQSKIFIFANISPNRSRNSLLNVGECQKFVNRLLRKYKKGEVSLTEMEKAMKDYNRDDLLMKLSSRKNPFSLPGFRAIQFTCRQLVRFPNPSYTRLYDLRQQMFLDRTSPHIIRELDQVLSNTKREIHFFFPFEIQLMDRESFRQNQIGLGSHADYKQQQLIASRKRVLGKLLEAQS